MSGVENPGPVADPVPDRPAGRVRGAPRRSMVLRLDPAVHEALARWAADELRSTNSHLEWLLRRALREAGREPGGAGRAADADQLTEGARQEGQEDKGGPA